MILSMEDNKKKTKNEYLRKYKERKRRENGVPTKAESAKLVGMRLRNTLEQDIISKENRKIWVKEWKMEYHKQNPKKKLLWAARRRAKDKGLDFNITEEDIIIPEYCPYLGIKLEHNARRGTDRANVLSLDRVNPKLGYVKGNIEVISHKANTMKNNATVSELISFSKQVMKRYLNDTVL